MCLIYQPLLVTAGVGNAEDGRSEEIYLSGLATAYTSWILTTFVIAPLLPLLVLLGDIYVWPYLGLLFSIIVPPLYLLQRPQALPSRQTKRMSQDLQGE